MSLCPLLVSFRLCLHVQNQNLPCLSIPRAWHQKYLTWAMLTEHDHPFFCICSNRLIAGGFLSMYRCKRERVIFPVLPHQSVVVCFHLSQSHLVTLPRHLEWVHLSLAARKKSWSPVRAEAFVHIQKVAGSSLWKITGFFSPLSKGKQHMIIWTLHGIPRELIILVCDAVFQRLTLVCVATTELFQKGGQLACFWLPTPAEMGPVHSSPSGCCSLAYVAWVGWPPLKTSPCFFPEHPGKVHRGVQTTAEWQTTPALEFTQACVSTVFPLWGKEVWEVSSEKQRRENGDSLSFADPEMENFPTLVFPVPLWWRDDPLFLAV